jgi:hypothetical protein
MTNKTGARNAKTAQRKQGMRCERHHTFLTRSGDCLDCDQEDREAGGWDGPLQFGSRRINHLPEE